MKATSAVLIVGFAAALGGGCSMRLLSTGSAPPGPPERKAADCKGAGCAQSGVVARDHVFCQNTAHKLVEHASPNFPAAGVFDHERQRFINRDHASRKFRNNVWPSGVMKLSG